MPPLLESCQSFWERAGSPFGEKLPLPFETALRLPFTLEKAATCFLKAVRGHQTNQATALLYTQPTDTPRPQPKTRTNTTKRMHTSQPGIERGNRCQPPPSLPNTDVLCLPASNCSSLLLLLVMLARLSTNPTPLLPPSHSNSHQQCTIPAGPSVGAAAALEPHTPSCLMPACRLQHNTSCQPACHCNTRCQLLTPGCCCCHASLPVTQPASPVL